MNSSTSVCGSAQACPHTTPSPARMTLASSTIDAMLCQNDRSMRLKNKIAVVVGAGQGPGEGLGNGRAVTMRFVQEGASVLAVDLDLASAKDTVKLAGGDCVAFEADVTTEATLAAAIRAARGRWGRLDILAVDTRARVSGKTRAEVAALRDAKVPLRRKMGTA